MPTKKTTQPQQVTFYRPQTWWRPAAIMNESGATTRILGSIAIYNAEGVLMWLDSCDLGDKVKDTPANINIPIIWQTKKQPDYNEPRAHIVSHTNICDEKKYDLFIPAAAVTITDEGESISKSCAWVRHFYSVEGIPARFHSIVFHPFDRYAMIHELESLQKEQYRVLTGDDITSPYAQKRIAEFLAKLEKYTAEAERIEGLTQEEYKQECYAGVTAYQWNDGNYRPIRPEDTSA